MTHTLEQIKQEHESFLKWVNNLKTISNNTWSSPYTDGKWSPSEIIAHLLFWDRFMLSLSIIDVQPGDCLPDFPPIQEENERAAKYAREIESKEQLIEEFIETRKNFLSQINELNEDQLNIPFKVGNHSYTVLSLLEDFQGHDLHHKQQIQSVL